MTELKENNTSKFGVSRIAVRLLGLIGAFVSILPPASAEIWVCAGGGSKSMFYTSTQSAVEADSCRPIESSAAAVSTYSAELYQRTYAIQHEITGSEKAQKSARRIKPRSEKAPVLSWRSQDVSRTKTGRRHFVSGDSHCEISGTVQGKLSDGGTVQILRGMLTANSVPISPGSGRHKWSVVLDGPCRNPEVKLTVTQRREINN